MRVGSRAGVSLVEALVALVVGLLVIQLALSTLARFRSAQRDLQVRSDELVARRVARHVLRRELRHATAGRDWYADADSLSLRAFRGTGVVCAVDSVAAELTVAYRGDRAPDPTKDSVLLVRGDGSSSTRAVASTGVASASCPASFLGASVRLRLDVAAPSGTVVARLYERGSYHLQGAALRYRRGASGRQPLTPEVWSAATGWQVSGDRLGVHLVPTSGGRTWSGFLAWESHE